jgi:5-formyltetrahydrofolate cyclo-ligase
MGKTELRQSLKEKLMTHDRTDAARKSHIIKNKLSSMDEFKTAKSMLCYVSMKEEVCTTEIIRSAIANKYVYVPVMEGNEIIPSRITDFGGLLTHPKIQDNKHNFDIIIIPGIAFDTRCARLGRGRGCFDRFLQTATGKKIALAFDFQVIDHVDTEEHDIFVDKIITEKRTLYRPRPV